MKKTFLLLSLIAFILLGSLTKAHAYTISGWFTADNQFWAWGYLGAGNWGEPVWYSFNSGAEPRWQTPEYFYGEGDETETIDFYFAARNDGGPAGLLGTMTIDGGTFLQTGTNKLSTDTTHWQAWTIVVPGTDFPHSKNPANMVNAWVTPTSYGTNGDSPWGSFANIDSSANWIWTGSTDENYVILRTRVTAVPNATPEPSTVSLLGIGLLGLFRLRKRHA